MSSHCVCASYKWCNLPWTLLNCKSGRTLLPKTLASTKSISCTDMRYMRFAVQTCSLCQTKSTAWKVYKYIAKKAMMMSDMPACYSICYSSIHWHNNWRQHQQTHCGSAAHTQVHTSVLTVDCHVNCCLRMWTNQFQFLLSMRAICTKMLLYHINLHVLPRDAISR
jgi:hypothetical protein